MTRHAVGTPNKVSQRHNGHAGARGDRLDLHFDRHSLSVLRSAVAAGARRLGIHPTQLHSLLLITSELATNAIRHGDGTGRLRLWRDDRALHCQIIDNGPGISDPTAGTAPPAPGIQHGRGLWIVRQLASDLTVTRRPDDVGTVITATIPIKPDGA